MKSISVLSLLALAISPALSQDYAAAIDETPMSAPLHSRAELVPIACSRADLLIGKQIAEIEHLQSRKLPVPADLAGYLFAVWHGRDMLGCPDSPLLSGTTSSTSGSKKSKRSKATADLVQPTGGHLPGYGDPCAVAKILRVQVTEQMTVLRANNIGIPPYLAGWYSVTDDMNNFLKCGLPASTLSNEVNEDSAN